MMAMIATMPLWYSSAGPLMIAPMVVVNVTTRSTTFGAAMDITARPVLSTSAAIEARVVDPKAAAAVLRFAPSAFEKVDASGEAALPRLVMELAMSVLLPVLITLTSKSTLTTMELASRRPAAIAVVRKAAASRRVADSVTVTELMDKSFASAPNAKAKLFAMASFPASVLRSVFTPAAVLVPAPKENDIALCTAFCTAVCTPTG
mmetsp:Transcript_161167/g.517319  ORF Transcript_161167/g.517319 Transcript_161167/m.517319 type:complete len:205 (+) Transcript_161167:841-1455(+)